MSTEEARGHDASLRRSCRECKKLMSPFWESDEDDLSEDEYVSDVKDDSCIVFHHSDPLLCCSIDPKSGKTAVTSGNDRAFIWDISTGNMLLECKGHKDYVTDVSFNFDGKLVATGDQKGHIQVWKMTTKSLLWDTNIDDLTWMKWHHAANDLLAGTSSGDVYIWRIPSGECKILPGDGCTTRCAVVMPDGKRCAVGYDDGVVKVFDMKRVFCMHRIETEESEAGRRPLGSNDKYLCFYVASVVCMEANVDNNLLITGSLNGVTHLITTQNGKIVGKLLPVDPPPIPGGTTWTEERSRAGVITTVGFCKDNSLCLAATGNLNGMLCIWDISQQVPCHSVRPSGGINKLVWDKNTHIYTSCLDGVIRIYDGRSGSLVRELYGHNGDIVDIAVSVNGDRLVSISDDNTARVFSLLPVDR